MQENSEEKKAEDEGLHAKILDALPVPVFYKDRIGRYLGFNKAYENFFGATKDKLVGKTVFDINPPELAVVYNTKDTELFTKGGVQQYESQVKSVDGSLREVVFNKAIFSDNQGSPAGIVGAILDITDKKKEEKIICEKEAELREIIENSPVATIVDMIADGSEKALIINKEFTELFGYTIDDLPDVNHWWALAYPDEKIREIASAKFNETVTQATGNKVKILPVESSVVCKDGTVRYVRISLSSLGDKNIITFEDLTDRKLSDKEHQANLKFMESMDKVNKVILGTDDLDEMMRNVLDAVLTTFDCDRAWLITPCDPWTLSYRVPMERTKPEWPGAASLGIEVPVDPDTTILFQKTRSTDGPVEFNSQTDPVLPPELTEHFHIKSQLVMEIHPKVPESWMVGMHQCSYERVWTSEEKRLFQEMGRRIADALTSLLSYRNLKQSEEKYSRIITTAAEGILSIDKDHKFTFINPRMLDMLGYKQKEILGHKFEEFILPEEMADHEHQMEERRNGKATVYDRRFKRKDGSIIWCSVSGTSVLNDTGEYDGSFGMITDITERKKAEQSFIEQEKFSQSLLRFSRDLEQAQTYGEILFAATREIGTILGYTHVWAYSFTDDNKYAHKISAVSPVEGTTNDVYIDNRASLVTISGDPMMEALATTKEIVVVADAQIDPTVNHELVKELGNRTIVNIPIVLFDRNLGIFGAGTFGDEGVRVPSKPEQEYLAAMASHIAVAFDRIRLLEERKKAEEELLEKDKLSDSLLHFSRELEQSQTYGDALKAAQNEIKKIIGYTNVWAYRVDEKKEYAYSIAATGSSAGDVMSEEGTAKLKIEGDPMIEAIVNAKDIIVVEDAQTDPSTNKEIVKKLGNRTLVNVPVILFDRNLGSIGMGTFGDEGVRVPTKSEQEYLIAMASHMAVAFDRIRLLEERRKTTEQLRSNELKLMEAQRIGQFGNFDWNVSSDTAFWSEEFYRIHGLDPAGGPLGYEEYLKVLSKESATTFSAAIKNTLETGEALVVDVEYAQPGGIKKWINIHGEAMRNESNNITGIRGTAQDVTRAKEIEKMRVDFLSLASHQLRTPLSGTKWLIETLEKGIHGPLTKGQVEYLAEIHKINERMTRLVSDMLTALRVESTDEIIVKNPIPIEQLFGDLMLSVGATAKSRGIVIRDDSSRHPTPKIESDMNFLSIVLSTFLSNAVNYSPDGQEVIFDVVEEEGGVAFSVRDFGIGIPSDEQEYVYQRFFRAVNAKMVRPEGTGLGLYIANIIARKLNGTISFTSEVGKGTVFVLHLPNH